MKTIITGWLLIVSAFFLGCGEDKAQKSNKTVPSPEQVSQASAAANKRFDELFDQMVLRSPETQTYLGLKENYGEWDDITEEFALESLELNKAMLEEVKGMDTSLFDPSTLLSWKMLKTSLKEDIADFQWRNHSYPVNQMFGVHSSIPALLINAHQVTNLSDAEAYISRLNLVEKKMDQLISGLKTREELGVNTPQFVFAHVIRDSENILIGAPYDDGEPSTLLADFVRKLDALDGVDEKTAANLIAQAEAAMLQSVKPGYEKLIEYLSVVSAKMPESNGVWALPDGEAYYNTMLARTTTTKLTADEIHQMGLDGVERIHGEMRQIMKKVGYEGSLQEFFVFMREDPQFYYENGTEGREAYLSKTHELIDAMRDQLDGLFITKPKAELDVKAVEAFREKSAGKAFYQRPAPDGSRPGRYYVNLYEMADMPIYQMEALAYHEALPGHHMQLAIAQELEGIPKFRRFGGFTAYIEGWGLYSEKIPKELGFYSDPYSDFGRLAMELWRATRLVVDTGIHAKKWTLEEAVNYLVENTPNSERDCRRAIERYFVLPSQATAYFVGMAKILDLRESAKHSLGDKFDIREFHDVILADGALPLNILTEKVASWVSSKQI